MASTIKLKNGSGAPTTGDLVQGEPALDLTNKRLYTENASGVVIEVGTNPSTIDINAGTIDGTVIGGTTPAAITGTTITGTSFVSSGDMTFEDNDKAVFGNGSDLRIYHTGSHSTIENIGTGHLQIHSTDFRLRNSAGTESMILANADGNVQLYYDNAEKLATTATGIDVTGTVTADGLTVDGDATITSASTNSTGFTIGNTAASGVNWTLYSSGGGPSVAGSFGIYNNSTSTNALILSASNNLGLGVAPSAWSQGSAFELLAPGMGLWNGSGSPSSIYMTSNAYFNGGFKYGGNGEASHYYQYLGQHVWSTATSGTAGNAISFTQAMTLDTSGNLLVGKTATNSATAGAEVRATGALLSAVTSNFCGFFNRISTDGTIIEFAKNGTTVGSIGTRASLLKIGTGDVGLLFNSSSDAILPENIDGGVGRDAAIDLGVAGAKFKDLYLSGGVYLGGTGAANLLDDYETGNFDPDVTTANSDMSGITYASQLGSYVKVGDLVWFRLQVGFSATTIGTGNFRITNLPFVSKNDAEARQSAQVLTYNLTWDSTWQQIATEGVQNSSFIDFLISRSGSTWVNLKATDMSNSTTYYYIVSGCYVTN
jgi:hypothetical protein